jgi:hypothetical protein
MSRSFVKILANLIQSNQIDVSIMFEKNSKEQLCESLVNYPKKTLKFIKKYIPNIENIVSELSENLYSQYSSFIVIGCPESTDIDIILFVDPKYIDKSNPRPLSYTENERLRHELQTIGYDTTRHIDINIISVVDGFCIGMSKGGDEIINIIINTHQYHTQLYELPNLHTVQSNVIDRIRSISRFIIMHIKTVVNESEYLKFREEKNRIHMAGTDEIIKYSLFLLQQINMINHTKNWYDFMKSLTMKIIQLLILKESNIYIYTKKELSEIVENYGFRKENAYYLLFRGRRGIYDIDDTLKLIRYYSDSVENYFSETKFIKLIYETSDIENCTLLSQELFDMFIQSPNYPIQCENWSQIRNINDLFPIEHTEISEIELPDELIQKHIIPVAQRSDEWHQLLKFYQCGRNSHENIKPTVEGMYNLLRGAITESIIINKFDPSIIGLDGWKKINVGLLVEEKDREKSPGSAPDLLLIKENKIIPVEIKTLKNGIHNADFYNKLDLAKRQLNSVENIIGKDYIDRKIIIFAHWEQRLHLDILIIPHPHPHQSSVLHS